MPRIFDLDAKFAGLAGLCGVPITSTNIGAALFEELVDDGDSGQQRIREYVSKLKSGEKPLETLEAFRLTSYFNQVIAKEILQNNTASGRMPIRPEDWSVSLNEFFKNVARHVEDETALDRAHYAIVSSLRALDQYRDKAVPLSIASDAGPSAELTRFPASAVAVDTLTLPTVPLRAGPQKEMVIWLSSPPRVPSKGWLFFVRNPDMRRNAAGMTKRIWDQEPADLIRWHPSPFRIAAGQLDPIDGYPTPIANIEGEFTAYLLIEEEQAQGVLRVLNEHKITWDPANPKYEPTLHLIARGDSLFQKRKGGREFALDYAPPQLLVRRYRVSNV